MKVLKNSKHDDGAKYAQKTIQYIPQHGNQDTSSFRTL